VEFLDLPSGEAKGDVEIRGVARTEGGAGVVRVELYLDGRRISDYPTATIPTDSKTTVQLPSTQATAVGNESTTMVDLCASLRQQLVSSTGVDAMPTKNDLILLGKLATKDSTAIEVKSTAPDLASAVLGKGIARGQSKPILASWTLTGAAVRGDVVGVVIMENKKRIAEIPYEVSDAMSADVLVSQLAGRFQSQAPESYKFLSPPSKDEQRAGMLTLQAPAERQPNSPSAVLVIRSQPGSTLDSNLKDKLFPLTDPTAGSYDMAIVRLGLGVREAHVKAKIPTAKLPDGRHRLRLTATRGWSNQSTAFAETDIVVHNGPARLTLSSTLSKLQAGSSPTVAAKAQWVGASVDEIEYLIDGQPAGVAKAPDFELLLDPTKWGVGEHQVTARARLADGKRILSDDALKLEIVK
jgi:hypothetical protein